jgi:hypothetical protein
MKEETSDIKRCDEQDSINHNRAEILHVLKAERI